MFEQKMIDDYLVRSQQQGQDKDVIISGSYDIDRRAKQNGRGVKLFENLDSYRRPEEYHNNMQELMRVDEMQDLKYIEQLDIATISKMPIELPMATKEKQTSQE